MKENRSWLFLILTVLVLLVLAHFAESIYFSDFEYKVRTQMFNKALIEKENVLDECLEGMKPILAIEDHHGSVNESNIFSLAENNKITILEYFDNKLVHWSDNEFDVPVYLTDSIFKKPLIFLQNGWFLAKTIQSGNEEIVGLLRIRTDYSFENNIIKSGYEDGYRLPANVGFSTEENLSGFNIYDKNGDFLFALSFPEKRENTGFILLPLSLWIMAFIVIMVLLFRIVSMLDRHKKTWWAVLFLMVSFVIIYLLLLLSGKPSVLYQLELFSQYKFSLTDFIPSLGHLLILSILLAVFSGVYYKICPLKDISGDSEPKSYLSLTLLLILAATLISLYHLVFSNLVSSSNINFETYKVLELDIFSILGFVSLFFLITVPALFMLRIFIIARNLNIKTIILSVITSIGVFVLFFYDDSKTLVSLTIFFILFCLSVWFITKRKVVFFNITVVFSLLFGIYSLYFITNLSEERSTDILKIQAVSFSTENDPEAEHLLLDLWPQLTDDTFLKRIMSTESFSKADLDQLLQYLQEKYFTGYWGNFNIGIVQCYKDQQLQVGPENEIFENCFSFFDDRIRRDGHQLTGTGFYFIDNQGGRSYYLGRMFFESSSAATNGLFIELYSDVNVFQPGYSELLLDKKYHGYAGLKDYSFAKYINGEIVLRTGEFAYNKTDDEYVDKDSDYRIFKTSGFKHVLFKNGNATIVISRPALTIGDIIISFSYLFVFILIFSNLFLILIRPPQVKKLNHFNFRQKLQMSYIGIILFSFILIGVVVASLTISQYKSKHYENIKEKLNSVYLELDNKLSRETHLSDTWRSSEYSSLNDFLIRLSNIFNTDINLYDVHGFLIATSRPEIFYRNLVSSRINIMAWINLNDLSKSEYSQKEKIGTLEYISAYVPFLNADNEVLAYLNLPYFRMQSVIKKEISNLIVAVINFTLLLVVITMSIAVFISGRLTGPLSMLGKGLSSFELGKKSEHLSYKGNDEIGELVKQYNRMVDEIEESTHKLANSEREFAWREMAKQIAHEIKNPLTPMKLNVQQLLKSWKDKIPDFGVSLERFTKNQIEYIDNLSSIATAFSSFAKMPGANPVELNILDQLKITLELFKDTDNVSFSVEWPRESKVIVLADKEHLNGVFSNLLKNSIQSIPAGREGLIKVKLGVFSDKVLVTISDNGEGIPEDLKNKLFTPNFTTKSSGMGLGLSIVRRYVENAGGRIWFDSSADSGTSFFVELPLKYTVEKPI